MSDVCPRCIEDVSHQLKGIVRQALIEKRGFQLDVADYREIITPAFDELTRRVSELEAERDRRSVEAAEHVNNWEDMRAEILNGVDAPDGAVNWALGIIDDHQPSHGPPQDSVGFSVIAERDRLKKELEELADRHNKMLHPGIERLKGEG